MHNIVQYLTVSPGSEGQDGGPTPEDSVVELSLREPAAEGNEYQYHYPIFRIWLRHDVPQMLCL